MLLFGSPVYLAKYVCVLYACVPLCDFCALFMQAFIEDVKSRGPFIYSVLESAQAFLTQHPFQEPDEMLPDGKGLLLFLTTLLHCTQLHTFLKYMDVYCKPIL